MLAGVHVETVGRGPRVVLVHGSVGNGASTWAAQRPLAERFTLVIPDRPGSPPNGPVDPAIFLSEFSSLVIGRPVPPGRELSPALEQGVRTLMVERPPVEADPPLEELAQAPFPKLIVSGAHSAAFDRVCDVLTQRLRAERVVLPGQAHNAQRAPGFNERLLDFL